MLIWSGTKFFNSCQPGVMLRRKRRKRWPQKISIVSNVDLSYQVSANPLDGCSHVFIEIGSNKDVGMQIRKLFEPQLFQGDPALPIYQRWLRCRVLRRFMDWFHQWCVKHTFYAGSLAPLRQDKQTTFVQLDSTPKGLLRVLKEFHWKHLKTTTQTAESK